MTFLEMTLSGTVMILAVAALRSMTLRRLPKGTFVALWWLTALRLLVPVELPSRFSVYTLLESLRRAEVPAVPTAPAAAPYASARVAVIPGPPEAVSAPAPAPFPVWTAVWTAGAVLLALWFLIHYIRWRRRFRKSAPANCPNPSICFRRRVQIRVTDQIGAPLTYGLLRPVILLPETLDLKDEDAVSCVLAHELSHIRWLDGLLKLVLAAALCLHWFNPAVWLLYLLANRDMELRCDEAAVLTLGKDSRERYALTLIHLAELRNEYVPLCGFSHKSGMEERIQAIMNVKKQSLLACFIALVLVLGVTTAFATSAKPASNEEQEEWTAVREALPEGETIGREPLPEDEPILVPGPLPEGEPEDQEAPPEGEAISREPLPEDEPVLVPDPLPEGKADIPEGADMIWPVDSDKITNRFGSRANPGGEGIVEHNGVDIGGMEAEAPIYAAKEGTVKDTGYNAENGNYVRLSHGDGMETFYAHCQSVLVKTGDSVTLGQTIATVGSTGKSTGPHLHFEIVANGVQRDPGNYYHK